MKITHSMKLDTLLDSFETIFTADEIWNSLFDYTKILGVETFSYNHLPPPGSLDFDEKTFRARGFTPEKITNFMRRDAFFNNPFENRTLQLTHPLFWPSFQKKFSFSEEQWSFLKNFYFTNHANGLVIPVHGPNNRNGYVVLRFKDAHRRYSKSEVRDLHWACQYAHLTFCDLQSKKRKKPMSLTIREQEILMWVARGKSNSVIADILGISQHTVNGYLRRIYLKTRSSDRTTASLRAIGEALIDYWV